jgi:predicted transcriptional regulator
LIDIITKEEHYNVYELTKKGKYFLKKYALEEPKKEDS